MITFMVVLVCNVSKIFNKSLIKAILAKSEVGKTENIGQKFSYNNTKMTFDQPVSQIPS